MKSHPIIFLLILFLSMPSRAVAGDRQSYVKEVVASGEAVVEQLTPEEARQMAVRKARAYGIEKALGVEVASQTLVRDFTLMGDFIKTFLKRF